MKSYYSHIQSQWVPQPSCIFQLCHLEHRTFKVATLREEVDGRLTLAFNCLSPEGMHYTYKLQNFKTFYQLYKPCHYHRKIHYIAKSPQSSSVQFSSVARLCPTLCDPINHSTPGLPVHHQLLEFTQTHVPRVSDAIQPSHPLSSPSPPAPNPSQHQSLFQ